MPTRRVDLADRFGCTPLSVAAAAGRTELVEALLSSGAQVNHADNAKETPLMAAVRGPRLLMKPSPSPHFLLPTFVLPTSCPQVMHGKAETVRQLLDFEGLDVSATNSDGESALMLAVGEHEEGIVTALLAKQPKLDAADSQGRTALMRAVAQAYEEPARRRSLGATYAPNLDRLAVAAATAGATSPAPSTTATATPSLSAPSTPATPVATPLAAGLHPDLLTPSKAAGGEKAGGGTPGPSPGLSPSSQTWLLSSIRMMTLLLDAGASLEITDSDGADAHELAIGAPSVINLLRERSKGSAHTKDGADKATARKAGGGAKGTARTGGATKGTAEPTRGTTEVTAKSATPAVTAVTAVTADAKEIKVDVGGGCCALQ